MIEHDMMPAQGAEDLEDMHMQRSPTKAVFGRWATTQPIDAAADCCFWVWRGRRG